MSNDATGENVRVKFRYKEVEIEYEDLSPDRVEEFFEENVRPLLNQAIEDYTGEDPVPSNL